eukprot:TRINITY_DN6084_c0_g1_i1.p1 TRINITY_DN6084_c0_g1~~TRINITY_DN6084_c0_g1_i1.p1  ORF type:complete len:326 (+),score=43.30 TRINITY_DN6084_c0_g1_i1:131-979(+)
MVSALLNPMDVIKVRLQTQSQLARAQGTSLYAASPYNGFSHAFVKIFREEGYFRGLQKGFTASMIREISYSSLRLGLYDYVKSAIAGSADKDQFTLGQKILAGAITGAMGSAFVNPADLIKIRFQAVLPGEQRKYRHTLHAFVTIMRDEGGVRGLYKGALPTIVRASLLNSAQLASYDESKRFLLRHGYFNDNFSLHFTAACISGLVTTTVVNPADLVKTRWMTDRQRYTSPLDVLVKTVRNEGVLALFKGWVPNYMRLGPHFVLSLPLLEFIRRALGADGL